MVAGGGGEEGWGVDGVFGPSCSVVGVGVGDGVGVGVSVNVDVDVGAGVLGREGEEEGEEGERGEAEPEAEGGVSRDWSSLDRREGVEEGETEGGALEEEVEGVEALAGRREARQSTEREVVVREEL